ncbi:hypothetical protein CBR_g3798 [Chara braunii]|uniref:Uncharacterized protein n=1 Tax=Chara braunii TaxID=69332 RepID=A0A388KGA6_CHABU|nr:hypothetical protein CBR_g3798 [Chara braunii]|eukprot:GBG69100.1 hypothetical protein CBR_g3798 [Chara braunii]
MKVNSTKAETSTAIAALPSTSSFWRVIVRSATSFEMRKRAKSQGKKKKARITSVMQPVARVSLSAKTRKVRREEGRAVVTRSHECLSDIERGGSDCVQQSGGAESYTASSGLQISKSFMAGSTSNRRYVGHFRKAAAFLSLSRMSPDAFHGQCSVRTGHRWHSIFVQALDEDCSSERDGRLSKEVVRTPRCYVRCERQPWTHQRRVDCLLHWSLPAFGDTIAAAISVTLPSRVCGPDFQLGYAQCGSGADCPEGGDDASGSRAFGESQEGSQTSLPRSGHGSQRSERGRGRPSSAGRTAPLRTSPQTWADCEEGVSQFGPNLDRGSVEEVMGLWVGPKLPDVVLLEPVKLLQLLALFHLYCLFHGGACRVSVESILYPTQLCRLDLICDRRCKWAWHSALMTTNVYSSRLQEQLYHVTVTTGLKYTLLDNLCVALGLCSMHKPTFYKFMCTDVEVEEGCNSKVCRQGLRYCELAIDIVMRRGEPVTLMVDGRYDSARSAQHCTVTPIEYETRLVVGVHTLHQKTERKVSNALEVSAVVRLLRGLLERGLKIRCVVSDDCAALGPQLRAMNIECQKDCHHKIKNIRKHFRDMLKLKATKKVSNPHQCVSESQLMQFTKKELMEALTARFGPGTLTPKEKRLKKSEFVAVVMQKMYPYDSITNNQQLTVDPDDVMEFHAHEVEDAGRLPLFSREDDMYELILHVMGKQCSTDITLYYIEFLHTSAVETFQGIIIIYVKKWAHFEKSYSARVAIVVVRWNTHCLRNPIEYCARIPAGTSIRPIPGFNRHNEAADDSWVDRLAAFVFGSSGVSDWARRLLQNEERPYGGGPGSSPLPLSRNLFVGDRDLRVDVADDADSGSDHDVVGDNNIFIVDDEFEDIVIAGHDTGHASIWDSEGDNTELHSD